MSSAEREPTDPVPWVGIPRSVEEVEKVIRPAGEAPYAGKTGTLKGRVTMKGDPPPKETWSFPPECADAAATYGVAFRVGQEGALADALVTVSGYPGFVPARAPAEKVSIQGCAFDRTTIAIAFGQRLEVSNMDATASKVSYMPYLDPAPYRALMIAMPGGKPARIYAYQPAINYFLRDYMKRPFMAANVLVLKFATHDVTGLDGRYEIPGIPVGKVEVNGYLPRLDKTAKKELEIKEGDNVLDLELTYDAKKDKVVPVPLASEAARDAAASALPPKSVVPR